MAPKIVFGFDGEGPYTEDQVAKALTPHDRAGSAHRKAMKVRKDRQTGEILSTIHYGDDGLPHGD